MAKLRSVNTHFWDDTYIVNLDPIEKLLFLYFITNPLVNISGAYEISLRRIAFDTGIDSEMIVKILSRFEQSDKLIYREGWLLIVNFIKNQSLNPKIKTGITESAKCCPDWVKDRLSIAYPSLCIGYDNLNLNSNTNPKPNGASAALEPEGDSEDREASFVRPNPTTHSAPPDADPNAINPAADTELNRWLDAVATATGAKSRHTLAKSRDWASACIQAITEGRKLEDLIAVTRKELIRLKDNLQFFSPKNVLQMLQMQSKPDKPTEKKIYGYDDKNNPFYTNREFNAWQNKKWEMELQ
jgi:hypothetical protein